MTLAEIKKLIILTFVFLFTIFVLPKFSAATDYSSATYTVKDPVIDSGLVTSSSLNFGLGQSLSQIAIGQSTSASFQLWSGFQYYFLVDENTLTATAGDGEVDLAWTVPTTYLGVNVAGYEVGTGTTSGSYTFEDVGNVVNFTKSGLVNGTPYFFIIKAYATGGTFLVFSNEDTATPNGVAPPGGGGGGGGGSGSLTLSGKAYPNSELKILRDSHIIKTITADSSGNFSTTINGMSSGTFTFSVYATDANGNRSPSVAFERTISSNVTVTVNNIIIAPTIQTNYIQVKQGDPIVVSGYTGPNAPVTLYFTGPESFIANVISNLSGFYTYTLSTTSRTKGQYAVYAKSLIDGSFSPNSFSITFRIGDETVVVPPTGDCSKRSDLNCDGRVNLIDFSILLYFWDLTDISKNPRADIDGNGDVGLRDLSIMLFDWTG